MACWKSTFSGWSCFITSLWCHTLTDFHDFGINGNRRHHPILWYHWACQFKITVLEFLIKTMYWLFWFITWKPLVLLKCRYHFWVIWTIYFRMHACYIFRKSVDNFEMHTKHANFKLGVQYPIKFIYFVLFLLEGYYKICRRELPSTFKTFWYDCNIFRIPKRLAWVGSNFLKKYRLLNFFRDPGEKLNEWLMSGHDNYWHFVVRRDERCDDRTKYTVV